MWRVLQDCVYHTWVTSLAELKQRLLVEWRKLDYFVVATIKPSVSGDAISLLVSGLTVDILSTLCDRFMVQCVKLMSALWFLMFDCLSPKCNLSEMFYQAWSLYGRNNHSHTHSCFLNRLAKILSI